MGGVVDHKLVETEQHPQGYRPIKEKTVLKPRQSDSERCSCLLAKSVLSVSKIS